MNKSQVPQKGKVTVTILPPVGQVNRTERKDKRLVHESETKKDTVLDVATKKKSIPSEMDRRVSISRERSDHEEETHERETELGGSHVASNSNSRVSKFLVYYNEALRRRLLEELQAPVRVRPKTPVFSSSSESDSSDGEDSRNENTGNWRSALNKAKMVGKVANDEDDEGKQKWPKWPQHRGRPGFANRRKSEGEELKKALRKAEVLKRFRKKARIIIFCIRCVKNHCFKFRERSDLTPYMNTLEYIDYRAEQVKDLMFDRSKFRAKRQMRIPEETKKILSMRKSDRSEQEIYSAQIALRNIKSYSGLPARMQHMVAQAGVYESFESRRVITREGHPASAFYFILSGAVVAMKMDPERPIASAVDEYVKGDTFEEDAMIHESPRQITVLTKEPCEFLSISAADFQEIFMQGGVKNLNDPDQEMFLKSLRFLDGWPISLLQKHPKEFRFRYFKRGLTLTDDTQTSEWLIIVKSGSVSIMKKLKKVGPYESRKQGIKPLTEREARERKEQKRNWRRYVLPEVRCPLRKTDEIEEIEERPDGKPKPFQHPDIKVHTDGSGRDEKYYYPNLWTIKQSSGEEDTSTFSNINKQYLYLMSGSSSRNKGNTGNSGGDKRCTKSANIKQGKGGQRNNRTGARPRSETEVRSIATSESPVSLRSILYTRADTMETTSTEFDERLRDIAAGIDLKVEPLTDADLNPEFVKIQTLIKGDVWGLADLLLDDQPSFIIVSNGADCIMLKKNFYLQNCPEKLLQRMRQDLCPYPTDDSLQESLQVKVDWHDYRRCELSSTMLGMSGRRHLKENAVH